MNFVKRFFEFILFSNIYVAIGAVCLVQSTLLQLHQENHLLNYSLLVFFATLFVYNLQRIFYKTSESKELNSIRRNWIFKNTFLLKMFSLIGFAGSIVLFFFTDYRITFYLLPLFILALLYFVPFVKLRKSPWVKLFTLTIVWTAVTAVIPAVLVQYSNTQFFIVHIVTRFLFMLAICIPFDIRDMSIDKQENVVTLPLVFGEQKTKTLALICLMLYLVLVVGEYQIRMIDATLFTALLVATVLNSILILMTNRNRNEYFYVAAIDGTMILQGGILMIATCF